MINKGIKMTASAHKHISLYSQTGGSDKVYNLQIDAVEGGYNLIYANGRRGQTLKPKVKNPSPLTLEQAEKEFSKIVKSKKNGSSKYKESGDEGSTLIPTEKDDLNSGVHPQLLNPIDHAQAVALCHDDGWVAQEKHDGERRPIEIKSGKVNGINKKGEYCGLVSDIANGIDSSVDIIFDTEDLRTRAAAFDLLEYNKKDLRQLPFIERYSILEAIANEHPALVVSPLAVTTEEKINLLDKMEHENREGVVFKRANAHYVSGRPSSGGDQLKFKFYDETSVIVSKVNAKRSVQIAVFDDEGNEIIVGNVTIPPNASIPSIGDIIDVFYLYAYKGGSLYQPIYDKQRNDVDSSECLQSRLKFRNDSH